MANGRELLRRTVGKALCVGVVTVDQTVDLIAHIFAHSNFFEFQQGLMGSGTQQELRQLRTFFKVQDPVSLMRDPAGFQLQIFEQQTGPQCRAAIDERKLQMVTLTRIGHRAAGEI